MNEFLQQYDSLRSEVKTFAFNGSLPLENEVFQDIKGKFENDTQLSDQEKILLVKRFLIFKAHYQVKKQLTAEYTAIILETLKNTTDIEYQVFVDDIQKEAKKATSELSEEIQIQNFVEKAFISFTPDTEKKAFIEAFSKTYFSFIKDNKYRSNYSSLGGFFSDSIHPKRFPNSLNVWDQKSLIELLETTLNQNKQLHKNLVGATFEIKTLQKITDEDGKTRDTNRVIRVKIKITETGVSNTPDSFTQKLGGNTDNFISSPETKNFNDYLEKLSLYLIGNDIELLKLYNANKQVFHKNLVTFIKFIAALESNLGTLKEHELSTAKGIFHFLTGVVNGKDIDVVDITRYPKSSDSSLGVSLIQIQKLLGQQEFSNGLYSVELKNLVKNAQDSFYDLRKLSGEMQSILFISQLIQRTKTPVSGNGGDILRQKLLQAFFTGDMNIILGIYASYHHTEKGILSSDNVKRKSRVYTKEFSTVSTEDAKKLLQLLGLIKEQQNQVPSLTDQKNMLTAANTKITDTNVENILKEILKLLGYDTSSDIKTILQKFQTDNSLPEPTGFYGLNTKKTFGKLLDDIIAGKHPKITRQQLEDILKKYPLTQKKAETKSEKITITALVGKEYTPTILDVSQVGLKVTPAFYFDDIFSTKTKEIKLGNTKISTLNNTQELKKYFEENAQKLQEMFTHFGISSYIPKPGQNERFGQNYSSRVLQYYLEAFKKGTLPAVITDYTHAQKLVQEGKLVQLETQTNLWRTGKGILGVPMIHFLTPQAKKTLQEICSRFQKKFAEKYHLTDGYTLRPIINSFIRPKQRNKQVGGSPISAHMLGIGIDISHMDFDLLKGDSYTTLSDRSYAEGKVPANTIEKSRLAIHARNVLIEVLLEMDVEGKLILTQEGSHPHITIKQ